MFRADSARHAGDPALERLIAILQRASPEFRDWWDERALVRPLGGTKRIDHPAIGPMVFEYSSFGVDDCGSTKLVVFTPLDEETTAKLGILVERNADRPVSSR